MVKCGQECVFPAKKLSPSGNKKLKKTAFPYKFQYTSRKQDNTISKL
jgi:hypothetical protein